MSENKEFNKIHSKRSLLGYKLFNDQSIGLILINIFLAFGSGCMGAYMGAYYGAKFNELDQDKSFRSYKVALLSACEIDKTSEADLQNLKFEKKLFLIDIIDNSKAMGTLLESFNEQNTKNFIKKIAELRNAQADFNEFVFENQNKKHKISQVSKNFSGAINNICEFINQNFLEKTGG